MAGLGLRKARETVESASARVTASAESVARTITAVAALALIAFGVGVLALLIATAAHRRLDA